MAAFVVATGGMVARRLATVLRHTQAVPPEEFPASAWLFAHETYAIWLHLGGAALALALLTAEWLAGRRSERRRALAVGSSLTALGLGLSLAHEVGPVLGVLGLGLVLGRRVTPRQHAIDDAAAAALEPLSVVSLWRRLPLVFWPAVGVLLAVCAELVWYTRPFSGAMFPNDAFQRFGVLAAGAALLAGARLSLAFFGLVWIARRLIEPEAASWRRALATGGVAGLTYLLIGLESIPWYEPAAVLLAATAAARARWRARPAVVLAVMPSAAFWVQTQSILFGVLGAEIRALHLAWLLHLVLALIATVATLWTLAGLERIFADARPRRTLEVLGAVVVSFVSPLTAVLRWPADQPVARRLRTAGRWATLVLAGYGLLMAELNYPSMTDFSKFLQRLWSMQLAVVAYVGMFVLSFCVLTPGPRHGRVARWGTLAVLAAAVVAFAAFEGRQLQRWIGAQYSKVAYRAIQVARVWPERARIGLTDDDQPTSPEPRWRRMATLPPLPPATAALMQTRRPPVFLLIWDAARPDHMSAYGYHRRTTPSAERLAADSVLFRRAYANATATTTSMRHILSGRLTSRYMLGTDHPPFFVGHLHAAGYEVLALNCIGSDFNGVSEDGFYRSQERPDELRAAASVFRHYEAQEKTVEAIRRIDALIAQSPTPERPLDGVFMYLHYGDTHYPWRSWDDHPVYGDGPVDLYDAAMGHTDVALGDLLDALVERGLYDESIIVLTADHGTGLGDHGQIGGFQPYEEQLLVPLIIKIPSLAPGVIDEAVVGIDLAPTLVNLVAAGQPNPFDGLSLVPLMAGLQDHLDRRYITSLSAFEDAMALIDLHTGLKLHVHRGERYEMLYDLTADPLERDNLADQRPEVVARNLDVVRWFLWRGRRTYGNPYHYRPATHADAGED